MERGGSINGEIAALNRILDLAFPDFRLEGGTLIIPGHGRLCDSADVAYYRDMVTIIRDRVQDMIKKGMTLEQVKAARPTRDYDGLYANTSGGSTPDTFVESVYKSLDAEEGIETWRAPAAMPSRGQVNPRRGMSVSSRRGWGPGASAKNDVPRCAR